MWSQEKIEQALKIKETALEQAKEKLSRNRTWIDAGTHMENIEFVVSVFRDYDMTKAEVEKLEEQVKVLKIILEK